ncbi:MAG: histidine--tRNA ligase [Acidobacteria bacterium]|nr:histidine--tRNA ligase [Acidobacteriota bacterium]
MTKTNPARGMRDFLPADVRRREYVMRVIRDVYERYGFEPLETPAVENIETLTGKYGEEGNQLIFKILKRGEHEKTGEADLALRYDLTVPLARVVAEYGDRLPKFFKRYQMQPVWRADRPARGRFREFYQCDVDWTGTRSMIVETELCAAACDALNELGFTNFTIRLNHRQVLAGILDSAGVTTEKHADVLTALDKLDKIGRGGVAEEFARREISFESSRKLLDFFDVPLGLEKAIQIVADESPEQQSQALNAAMLGRLVEFTGDHEQGSRGIDELRSLGGGGRYDELVGMFSKQSIPACGFSLGLERIVVVMTEREMFPPDLARASVDVMVTIWDEASAADSLALARELRASDLRVDVYPERRDKLGKQFKYAAALGVPFVAVVGADERGRGEVAIKDMASGEQWSVPRAGAAGALRERMAGNQR